MLHFTRFSGSVLPLVAGGASLLLAFPAAAASFSDVPVTHPAYEAVEYLKAKGYVSGYPDGTYQPDKKVNRAEAVKIIVAPLVKPEELATVQTSPFSDVAAGAWFLPYVEWARTKLGIVDGPPVKTAFLPEKPVLKAEFLKMLLLANKVNPQNAFAEIRLPLSKDVSNPDEWFYPFIRYGVTASLTMADKDGMFTPGRELTRSDVALFLFRSIMYTEGRRTQALLSEAENEIILTLNALEANDVVNAELASARALLAARGAHARQPDIPLVQGALKTSEAFRALVRGYRAGIEQNYGEVIRLSGEAWNLSERCRQLAPELSQISDQVQGIAKTMADSARTLKSAPPQVE